MENRRRRRLLFDMAAFDPIPVPPAPTPWDRVIEDPDGLDDYETTFDTAAVGGIIIGIAGKNNANNPVDFTVTVNDVPVQVLSAGIPNRLSGAFTYMAAVESLPIGTHTIKIVSNGESSSGTAALRIIETDVMPPDWLGETKSFVNYGSANGIAIGLPGVEIGSTVLLMSAWASERAYPPTCLLRQSDGSYVPQSTVRDDLVRDLLTCGFFRSTTVTTSPYFSLRCANPAGNTSVTLVELRGVTILT